MSRFRAWLARNKAGLVVAAAVVALVAVAVFFAARQPDQQVRLDPDNTTPSGSAVVAAVLEKNGTRVGVARSAAEFDAALQGLPAEQTTILVTSPGDLSPSTLEHLMDRSAGHRVVIASTPPSVVEMINEAFGTDVEVYNSAAAVGVPANCADPRFSDLSLDFPEEEAVLTGGGCFGFEDDAAALVALEAPSGDTWELLGGAQILTQRQVVKGDNAAAALRLLGTGDHLVWYVPSLLDHTAEEIENGGPLLPPVVIPALWLLLLSGVALVVWRGRRLGPLATEPLPVSVKAIESTLGQGRLYRRQSDVAHSAQALRQAVRAESASRLSVSPHDLKALCTAVADHTGRPLSEVEALIGATAPAPSSNTALVTLGHDLSALTEEVRTP